MKLTVLNGTLEIDYWKPTSRLEGLVSGYHRYSSCLHGRTTHKDALFPGWANIRFDLTSRWDVCINRRLTRMPGRCVVFGATSHVAYSEAEAGMVIGAGLTPRGWRRLTRVSADHVANRVVPFASICPDVSCHFDELVKSEKLGELAPFFDDWLSGLLAEEQPDEERIDTIQQLLLNETGLTVQMIADHIKLSERQLGNITRKSFGFAPKLLLRRSRFLRSLLSITQARNLSKAMLDQSYHDYSHFLRDCKMFLGMSPRLFLNLPKPFFDASVIARASALGAPAQALAPPPERAPRVSKR